MDRTTGRKPLSNFFVKKALQAGVVVRVTLAAMGATLISVATIVMVYYIQHRSVSIYQLQETGNLNKESIFSLILPSLIISIVVNLCLALAIGLYASRKYAVPVYKLEQWAQLLRSGKLNATLRFRESQELRELTDEFNSLTKDLREKFTEVDKLMQVLRATDHHKDQQVQRVAEMVAALELTSKSPGMKMDATGIITQS